MNAPQLALENLRVALGGRTVLAIDELCFAAGKVSTVVGENGAGKSTLLLAAAGLLTLTQGRVLLGGVLFHQGRAPAALDARRRVAIAFQEPYFFFGTVRQNVALGLRWRGLPRGVRLQRSEAVLERLSIGSLAGRRCNQLSGGERRLVGLARALVLEPEVLLLDEPTAFLDVEALARVEQVLDQVQACGHLTAVVATHDAKFARRFGQAPFALGEGRLLIRAGE